MSCPKCFSGHINSSTPKGRIEKVFDRECYIAEPEAGKDVKGIIVIISDAFGMQFVNNQILADHYATKGDFKVYLPDFMDGTAAPISMITTIHSVMEDMSITGWLKKPYHVGSLLYTALPWKSKNEYTKSMPKVTSWLQALRESPEGQKYAIGAAGFCWGGKHTVNLCHIYKTPAGQPLIDAGFTAHPSNLDIGKELEGVRLPLSIAQPEKDMSLKPAQYETIKEILGKMEKEHGTKWECIEYKGATHGFSVRADETKDEAKQAVEAEEQAVKWFQKHFAEVKQRS